MIRNLDIRGGGGDAVDQVSRYVKKHLQSRLRSLTTSNSLGRQDNKYFKLVDKS